jgi:hypothetical protein
MQDIVQVSPAQNIITIFCHIISGSRELAKKLESFGLQNALETLKLFCLDSNAIFRAQSFNHRVKILQKMKRASVFYLFENRSAEYSFSSTKA